MIIIISKEMMRFMVQRNTKQKTGIMNFLISRKDHPTAETVYTELKKTFPNISLGTVYRNLNTLSQSGEILKLRFDDGLDHFDATTEDHHHFICRQCGAVQDVFNVDDSIRILPGAYDGEVTGHFVYFYGFCPECKAHKEV